MYRDLKPCVRCNGVGVIQVIDFSDPYCLLGEEWPMKDAKCMGCNGTGKVSKGERDADSGREVEHLPAVDLRSTAAGRDPVEA